MTGQPGSGGSTVSLAVGQRSLRDPSIIYPLLPPLTEGCPRTSTPDIQYPVEVTYDYSAVDRSLFDQPVAPGLRQWAPLLPTLAPALHLAEGGTPLISAPRLATFARLDGDLYVKDETRNPTWSHKDRLNIVTTSTAIQICAPGIVVASSGNHGASAAAYAAAAGLRCLVITNSGSRPSIKRFLASYGAAVVAVPEEARWPLMREAVRRLGFHPASNLTRTHTGHGFAPEGYKTIAYELFVQLARRAPAAIFVPTGYGELLFGVWKGFVELHEFGLIDRLPKMFACEPDVRAPLARAMAQGADAVVVDARPSRAFSIASRVSGYRGIVAVRDSAGAAIAVSENEIQEAHEAQSVNGLWHEISSAAGLAGLRHVIATGWRFDGPVVIVSTSCGFKGMEEEDERSRFIEAGPDWESFSGALRKLGMTVVS